MFHVAVCAELSVPLKSRSGGQQNRPTAGFWFLCVFLNGLLLFYFFPLQLELLPLTDFTVHFMFLLVCRAACCF